MASVLLRTTHRAVSWRYYVEIDGVTAAEFTECSGLSIERETTPITEGGRTNYAVKLPGRIKYSDITLKRGLLDLELLDWLIINADQNTIKPTFKNVIIHLANESGEEAFKWTLFHAYPIKWTGPSLKADSNELSMEELVLTFTYFETEAVDRPNALAGAANKLKALNPL